MEKANKIIRILLIITVACYSISACVMIFCENISYDQSEFLGWLNLIYIPLFVMMLAVFNMLTE
jgi:cytochrome bd-type quinol oxidase subunit 2